MAITASMVKELRERTGAGMMECKKALTESNGDIEVAIENMRKSGQAKAAKKAGRTAADGVIVMAQDAARAVMVEVNCETDFVAKDENFRSFADAVAAMETGSHSKTPVQTQFGWHVIKAESTRDLPAPSLDEMREQIVPGVQQRKVQNYIEAIRASADVSRKDSPAAQ